MQRSRVTIDSLHLEIYFIIFSFLLDIPEDPGKPQLATIPECFAVSSVSRRWREIAYACSKLWSVIPTQNLIWTERALQLSKNRPLYMHLFPQQERVPLIRYRNVKGSLLALRHLSRAYHVIIGARGHLPMIGKLVDEVSDALMRCSPPPFETLEILNFSFNYVQYENDEKPTKLRELLLCGNTVLSTAPILRSSTIADLTLCNVRLRKDEFFHTEYAHGKVNDLLANILSYIPTLRRLAISQVFSDSYCVRKLHQPTISLPNLEYLAIAGMFSQDSDLLSWLDLPIGVKIHIAAFGHYTPDVVDEAKQPLRFLNEIYLRNKAKTFAGYFSGIRIDLPKRLVRNSKEATAVFLPLRSVTDTSAEVFGPQYAYAVWREHWRSWSLLKDDIITLLDSLPLVEASRVRKLEVWHPRP
jgi:hypothetical protein